MFNKFIFLPLYNGLVGIMNIIPGIDLGLATIIFTVIIKIILFPLSKSSLLTQVKMKEVEPEANRIKAQYASDRQTQALKIMELYKERKVRPFAGILLVFIQLPILFGLISVFYKLIPDIHPEFLYSFIHLPVSSPTLLGLDLTSKSLVLALITGLAQFLQLHFSIAARRAKIDKLNKPKEPVALDATTQFANSMTSQMKYTLPIIAFVSVYWIIPSSFPQAASIIAIYWSVSALVTLAQELYVEKKYLANKPRL